VVVLFVDDNQADVAARCEDGTARAHDNIGAPGPRAAPLIEALARTQSRM
jgi:hypothetical protein